MSTYRLLNFLWFWLSCHFLFGQVNSLNFNLDSLTFTEHAFFGYESYKIYNEIFVVEDTNQNFCLKNISQLENEFVRNDPSFVVKKNTIYWLRLDIYSEVERTVLLEAGKERISTWKEVDFYLIKQDSLIHKGKTGTGRSHHEKDIRNAFNLFRLLLPQGHSTLYIKMKGLSMMKDHPKWKNRYKNTKSEIALYLHKEASYFALNGYEFKGKYGNPKRGFIFSHNYFKQSLEVLDDSNGTLSLNEVIKRWDDEYHYKISDYPDPGKVYWLRFKVIGTEVGPSTHLMGLNTGTHWNFGKMKIYTIDQQEKISTQLTGRNQALSQKTFESNWNLFEVKAKPRDTTTVYMRLSNAGKCFVPEIAMSHIDQSTFWPRIFNIKMIYGAFFGILCVQAFYFLILGFIEKEQLHFWFVCMILGFGLALAFVGGDLNFFIFSQYEEYHPWLTGLGVFMMVLGLFKYLHLFLSLEDYFQFKTSKLINPLIIVHGFICILFSICLESIGGNIAVYEYYFKLLFASVIFNFLIGITFGIIVWFKGSTDAKFFVGAFAALILILIVRLAFAFESFQGDGGFQQDTISIGLYIHYILFVGIVLTIILLGFSNGYRLNRLKLAQRSAIIRIEESKKRNELLRLKNDDIEKRAKEKEFLLKEVHHRVKNNLQILSSLLSLQSDSQDDKAITNALQESKNRVEAIGLIHQHLYTYDQVDAIDMQNYIDELCVYLSDSLVGSNFNLQFLPSIQIKKAHVNTAIPIGLIINELVTNSLKYAFVNRTNGKINISLKLNHAGQLHLEISDNGLGMAIGHENRERVNFGSRLVEILSKKLKGKINISKEDGYKTTLIFNRFTLVKE
ncbi:MAG: histidine kinase dimerization/phosphoacceptor domain -containing protein [Saprospiraceae bacterium]